MQAGGHPRVIPWDEFDQAFLRVINVFAIIRETIREKLSVYRSSKKVIGNLDSGPNFEWEVKI